MALQSLFSCIHVNTRQAVALLSCCLVLYGCSSTEIDPVVDPRPPDFTLNDLDGNSFRLSSTQGSVVLLHFFAPWCPVCQGDAPVISELHRDLSGLGLTVIAVAVQANSVAEIEDFRETYNIPYRILIDDGVVSRAGYGVSQIPTTYVIDREVNLLGPYGSRSKEDLVEILEPLF